jgi:hypothetical protein
LVAASLPSHWRANTYCEQNHALPFRAAS